MKRKIFNSKTMTALTIVGFLNIAIPTYAEDHSFLDTWEELETWVQNYGEKYATVAEAYNEQVPMSLEKVEAARTPSLISGLKETNDFDGINLTDLKALNLESNLINVNKTNPYQYPEEYRTP